MRKKTVFRLCETHANNMGSGRRLAENVVEGGPAFGKACSPTFCEVLPGLDYYAEGCTDEEFADLIRDWAVNRERAAQ